MKHSAVRIALEGRFRFVAVRPDGARRVLSDWGKNLILDGGLNRLGTGGAFGTCRVGSGNSAPSFTQTTLDTPVAASTSVQSQQSGTAVDNTYAWVRRTFRFPAGQAAGNLSEVGVGWESGLFSRALIKDDLGDPTTITVLADEVLDVSYEIRAYPNLSDQEFTVNISGVDYEFTVRPIALNGDLTSGGWATAIYTLISAGATQLHGNGLSAVSYNVGTTLAAVTANGLNGSQLYNGTPSYPTAYSNNSLERQCRNSYALNEGTTPFAGFLFRTACGLYQAVVSPPIPKDSTKTFSLDFTISWGRRAA